MNSRKYWNLVNSLNDICSKLDNDYSINSGGCCFLAYEIARYLDKLHIKYNLLIYSEQFKDIDEIEQEIKHKSTNRSTEKSVTGYNTCEHYFLEIIGGGIVNPDDCDEPYVINGVNHSHLLWIYKNGSWNDDYDTNNNKIIRKIIKSYFNAFTN